MSSCIIDLIFTHLCFNSLWLCISALICCIKDNNTVCSNGHGLNTVLYSAFSNVYSTKLRSLLNNALWKALLICPWAKRDLICSWMSKLLGAGVDACVRTADKSESSKDVACASKPFSISCLICSRTDRTMLTCSNLMSLFTSLTVSAVHFLTDDSTSLQILLGVDLIRSTISVERSSLALYCARYCSSFVVSER